jgi:hypothetical protein
LLTLSWNLNDYSLEIKKKVSFISPERAYIKNREAKPPGEEQK